VAYLTRPRASSWRCCDPAVVHNRPVSESVPVPSPVPQNHRCSYILFIVTFSSNAWYCMLAIPYGQRGAASPGSGRGRMLGS
jgi:hypothetical protein